MKEKVLFWFKRQLAKYFKRFHNVARLKNVNAFTSVTSSKRRPCREAKKQTNRKKKLKTGRDQLMVSVLVGRGRCLYHGNEIFV